MLGSLEEGAVARTRVVMEDCQGRNLGLEEHLDFRKVGRKNKDIPDGKLYQIAGAGGHQGLGESKK